MVLGSVFLPASTLNYNAVVWDAESRSIERPKAGELQGDEGESSSHLYSCWKSPIRVYKRKVLTDVLPQVSDMMEQKGRSSMNFKKNCLISNCWCNLLLQCFLRNVCFINSGREKKCFGSWSWATLKRNGWGESEEGGGMLPLGSIWLVELPLILHHLSLYSAWVLSWCREKRYFLQRAILGEEGGKEKSVKGTTEISASFPILISLSLYPGNAGVKCSLLYCWFCPPGLLILHCFLHLLFIIIPREEPSISIFGGKNPSSCWE